MNSAEKKVLNVAVALFLVGATVKVLPWGLPSIDQMDELTAEKISHPRIVDKVNNGVEISMESPSLEEASLVKNVDKNASPKRKRSKKKQKVVHLPIHINRAGVDELCALKGVGPKLAEKIIEVRDRNGGFSGPQDLQKVSGIGKKKAEGILQGVIFD